MMEKTRIGVVGCGMISDIYLTNLTGRFGHAVQDVYKRQMVNFMLPIKTKI